MPRVAKELSALEVDRLKEPGLYAVGGVAGLMLQVKPSGARSWKLRTMVGDRRRDIGLGGYPTVTLAQARDKARAARLLIEQGKDPVAEKREARARLAAALAKRLTFKTAAERCWKSRAKEFRNVKHAKQWLSTLEAYAFPVLGNLYVDDVETPHVLKALEPIWDDKTETATRVRQRIEAVLSWSAARGYRDKSKPNAAAWKGNLEHLLARPTKLKKTKHHPALPWQDVPAFVAELRKRSGMAAKALEFAILTAARSGDVRGATWSEIDLEQRLWRIPAERMKADRPHVVPLSDAVVKLLEELPQMEGTDLLFPGVKGQPLSDMALLEVCRRLKVPAVPHGFRSSFKDYARSLNGKYADEGSELCLAHVDSDATRAAYARDGLLEQRRELLAEWSAFLT